MRLWSLSPRYLDQQGLCGLWREAVMAKNAILVEDHGYHNHPQLDRFREYATYLGEEEHLLNDYLRIVYQESKKRGYDFNDKYLNQDFSIARRQLPVTNGQLRFERRHLINKMRTRDPIYRDIKKINKIVNLRIPDIHPIFYMVNGPKAEWECG